jgi:hypothetical protein
MNNQLTYRDVVGSYVYQLALIFRANNPEELRNAWNDFCRFRYIVQEAIDMVATSPGVESQVVQSGILNSIQKNILGTLNMYEHEIDFKQILSKMHDDLDDYKKLLNKEIAA